MKQCHNFNVNINKRRYHVICTYVVKIYINFTFTLCFIFQILIYYCVVSNMCPFLNIYEVSLL